MSDLDASGKHEWQTWPDPIVELNHPETTATIRYVGDGFELRWNDGVAGEWAEAWPRLDVAVMRLAVLMACGQADWVKGFASYEGVFNQGALDFIDLCRSFFDTHTE